MPAVKLHDSITAEAVSYEAATGRLCLKSNEMIYSIPFNKIPADDFESESPVIGFEISQSGTVVVCRHIDGAESWLPTDMWLADGFNP